MDLSTVDLALRSQTTRRAEGIHGIFEDDPLIVALATSFGLYAVVADRPFFSTLDAPFATCYHSVSYIKLCGFHQVDNGWRLGLT